jgi:hypothetical protein
VIAFATRSDAAATLRQIKSAAFRRCFVRRLSRFLRRRAEVLKVADRPVPGFQPLPNSAARRYVERLTFRGAFFFEVNDAFYFRVRSFLAVLLFGTAERLPLVSEEEAVFVKLRSRTITNFR